MRHRTVDIGVGGANQLDLSAFGPCNYASARHATLFFDQYSQVYELINYSEHGTVVDDTVYALNCRPPTSMRSAKTGPEFTMSAVPDGGASATPCYCDSSVSR